MAFAQTTNTLQYIKKYKVYSVQCTLYSVYCTVYRILDQKSSLWWPLHRWQQIPWHTYKSTKCTVYEFKTYMNCPLRYILLKQHFYLAETLLSGDKDFLGDRDLGVSFLGFPSFSFSLDGVLLLLLLVLLLFASFKGDFGGKRPEI